MLRKLKSSFPRLVSTDEDEQSLNYVKIVSLLIKATQEQQLQIKQNTKELENQREQVLNLQREK